MVSQLRKRPGVARPFARLKGWLAVLLDDDLDAAVLRLAHVVAGRHQELALALADDADRLGRHALADQRVLDRVGTPQRQRHVVALRSRRVGMTGRRDAGAALTLEGARCLTDRGQRLV